MYESISGDACPIDDLCSMSPEDLSPGMTVRALVDSEILTGIPGTSLALGTISSEDPIRACSRTTLIPVSLASAPDRIVWVRSSDILSASPYAHGGLP